jgi:hypothetical protein
MAGQDFRWVRKRGLLLCSASTLDAERAREAIKEAKAAGASFADFKKTTVRHCYNQIRAKGMLQAAYRGESV